MGRSPPRLVPKGWIGENHVVIAKGFAVIGEGIGLEDLALDTVEHGVHQGQAVGFGHQLDAGKSLTALELLLFSRNAISKIFVSLLL